MQQRHQLRAVRRRLAGLTLAARRPFVGRNPGNGLDVIARLGGQRSSARHPIAYPLRAGIIGGSRQPEIAELAPQLAQEFRRLRQRLDGIERIEQSAFRRGPRHELGDALGAGAAARARTDGAGLKPAFLPDHPREELKRQIVRTRRRFDHQAHGVAQVGRSILRGRCRRQRRIVIGTLTERALGVCQQHGQRNDRNACHAHARRRWRRRAVTA